jgi:hypothetical protein
MLSNAGTSSPSATYASCACRFIAILRMICQQMGRESVDFFFGTESKENVNETSIVSTKLCRSLSAVIMRNSGTAG